MTLFLPFLSGSVRRSPLSLAVAIPRACAFALLLPMLAGRADAGSIELSNLSHTYNGSQKSATVTTVPAGLAYTISYEGLTVPYAATSTPPAGAGSYTVVATIDDPVESGTATATLVINKAAQSITFATLSARTFGNAPFTLAATASSGLPVSYASSNTAVATISGNTVTITGAGTTNIVASQAGDSNFLPATDVLRTLTVNKATQTITFSAPTGKTFGNAPFALGGTASSGLPISYTSSKPAVATISGSTVTIVGAGSTNITASQPGDTNYSAATNVVKTMTVAKASQYITLGTMPMGKSYGDAPFSVTASVNTGFPLSIQSSDPTVATVSGNTVTIVGAGQCSILAIQAGTANYLYTAAAQPLDIAPASLPMPPAALSRIYSGAPQGIDTTNLPTGAAAQIRYRDLTQTESAPTPQVAFQNGPDTLDLSHNSIGFSANSVWGLGKYIELAGSARKLHSCDVTLVTWAKYDSNLNWVNANPSLVVAPTPGISIPGNTGGWYHPITLAFHDYDGDAKTWTRLTSQTVQAFIPWRPLKQSDGTTYPYSGYAFRVPFSFPDGVILPNPVWVTVSFDTNLYGTSPIGVAGPYDALNVANPVSNVAGRDLLSGYQLIYRNWLWQSPADFAGPMLRLKTIPTNATLTPPVEPGTYEVETVSTGFGIDSQTTTALTIAYDFPGWTARQLALGRLPAGFTGDSDDPDRDGLTNLEEYAFNLHPGLPDSAPGHPPKLSSAASDLLFTYRRNRHASDISYAIEGSLNLASPTTWNPVVPLLETPVSDDGTTRVIQATLPKPADAPHYFLRLKVSR